MKTIIFTAGLILAVSLTAQAQVWDILDETYGSEAGQISFLNTYPWPWTGTQPTEVLNDGYAALSHDAGIDYAAREDGTINLPTGDWQMDVKLQLDNALGFSFYLGDHDNVQNRSLVQVNSLYSETVQHPNTIGDYNQRIPDGGEIQPAGFDGSAPHVYSFISDSSKIDMYLDGEFLATLTGGAGVDAGYEAAQFGFGASLSPGPGTSKIYYVKISSEPAISSDTPGDANRDGYVDVTDLGILATNYNAGSGFGWGDADFTGDGFVNVNDLGILATNYGAVPSALAVPEPSTGILLFLGGMGLLLGRRYR